jgi:hypothetical protein
MRKYLRAARIRRTVMGTPVRMTTSEGHKSISLPYRRSELEQTNLKTRGKNIPRTAFRLNE